MLKGGFVKIHRKIVDWEWYHDATVSRVFLHLLFIANYESYKFEGLEIKPGQCVISLQKVAETLSLSKDSVDRALKKLEKSGELQRKPTAKFTIITLKNYTLYQQSATEADREPTESRPQADPMEERNKKDKERNKKDKEYIGKKTQKRFSPPSLEDVRSYCSERKNSVDPERFIDYYTANGWMVGKSKMKDWKAAVRTWEKNGFGDSGNKHDKSEDGKWCVYEGDVSWDDVFD